MFEISKEIIEEIKNLIALQPALATSNVDNYVFSSNGCHGCSGCTSCSGCSSCDGSK